MSKLWESISKGTVLFQQNNSSPIRYFILRRNIATLMLMITFIPLLLMLVINHFQYQSILENKIIGPLQLMVNKTKHSVQLTLEERLSALRFIASAYSPEELSDKKTLNRILHVIKEEFGGLADLSLINNQGFQVGYAGPYPLPGKNYSQQAWFQKALLKETYISNVFTGYREIPHIAIAVRIRSGEGNNWILRTGLDTNGFENFISLVEHDLDTDIFLINNEGVLQTSSRYYGKTLDKCPFPVPPRVYEPHIVKETDPDAREVIIAYSYFENSDYALMIVKSNSVVMQTWFSLQSEMFFTFFASAAVIIMIVIKLADVLVINIQNADKRRESAIRELEQHHKLSSIGRLSAGMAHEINNPLAIINQKAGLMKDIMEFEADFNEKEKFLEITDSILKSVNRCKAVTHRLLGFTRRKDIIFEDLDLNDLLKEVLGFINKEILYRNIRLNLEFADNLPKICSDQGQLQQVFLNILTNALSAVKNEGQITIITWEENSNTVGISCKDNGSGMSGEILSHIFDPFFTTKKGKGTGLGLSVTYGIVKKLGGDIKVRSKQGKGSEFTVYLPRENPAKLET
ncbi:MAG: two-component sensor histidine kinase [Desulfobacteraceae bacterium]|nr:two-component sensor histidine kinase [Desulfobacteraceae bacterium]